MYEQEPDLHEIEAECYPSLEAIEAEILRGPSRVYQAKYAHPQSQPHTLPDDMVLGICRACGQAWDENGDCVCDKSRGY
jgi:hypothetical protein